MDEELKRLLEENLEVTRENNELLKKIRRDAMIGLVVKAVLWLVILGVPIFFISTYLGPLLSGTGTTTIMGLPSAEDTQRLLEEYKSLYEGQ